jgi:hypothetical protein
LFVSFEFPTTYFQSARPLALFGLGVHQMTSKSQDSEPKTSNQNSTGPRTERGKKTASKNSTKFGIFSRETVLEGESWTEYESLRNGLWKSMQPGNGFEEILLDKIVSNLWRQRRVLTAERAEIRNRSEFLEFDDQQRMREEAEEAGKKFHEQISYRIAPEPVGLVWSIENPEVLARCIEVLAELRNGIKASGFNKEEDNFLLKKVYGDPAAAHLRATLQDEYLSWFITAQATEEQRAQEGYATPEECVKHVLRAIDVEVRRLKKYSEEREPIESARRQVEILRQRVPDSPATDRLLKYGSSLERACDRSLKQFERAQRIRKRQPLPPQDAH